MQQTNAQSEIDRVSKQIAARIAAAGVRLEGSETIDELADLQDAIERFEAAVEAHGGDLMMDEAPRRGKSQPDDPDFALPVRPSGESVADYLLRLSRATDTVSHHRAKR